MAYQPAVAPFGLAFAPWMQCAAHRAPVNRTPRQLQSAAAKRLICSLRTLADTTDVEAYAAWQAAQQMWPDTVVGSSNLYVRYLRQVWQAVHEPGDSVLLAFVLAKEGVIGVHTPLAAPAEAPQAQCACTQTVMPCVLLSVRIY